MPCYPDIASPCPVANRLDEVMDGSFCRRCRAPVADLDAMDLASRYRLMARTGGDLCVRYRLPTPAAALAAAVMAAGMSVLPAAAQEVLVEPIAAQPAAHEEVIVGGARLLTRAERLEMEREARREERRAKREQRRAEKAARSPAS